MLLMRSNEDADGETRTMGSGRRVDFFGRFTRDGLFGVLEVAAVVAVDEAP